MAAGYWATAFRALGDVLHLNQDMAQPQHTRNEPHSGQDMSVAAICAAGHTSVYEKYINARALLQTSFSSGHPFNAPLTMPAKPLSISSYPIPSFEKYTDYWSTAPGNQAVHGKGLADYSNRGFFTAAKNFESTEYPSPSRNPSSYVIASLVPTRWDGSASTDSTPTHVYYGEVADAWQQSSTANVPLTTYSLWDQFVRAQSGAPAYSLNRLNYDAMADLLLPRAVAYSAGLINFFFRGRIDIELPDEGVFALADHASDQGLHDAAREGPQYDGGVRRSAGQREAPAHERRSVFRGHSIPQGPAIRSQPRHGRRRVAVYRFPDRRQFREARRIDAMPRRRRADHRVAACLRRALQADEQKLARIRVSATRRFPSI